MRNLSWLVAFVLTLHTLHVVAKEPPGEILARLPKELGGCQRGEVRDYGDPRLGKSVAYDAAGITLTVYVYDLGQAHIGDGAADRVVAAAFASAKRDLATAREKGMYSDVDFVQETHETFAGVEMLSARFRLTFAEGRMAGVKAASEIHMFGRAEQIIKLRITGKVEEEERLHEVVKEFLPALVKAIPAGAPAP